MIDPPAIIWVVLAFVAIAIPLIGHVSPFKIQNQSILNRRQVYSIIWVALMIHVIQATIMIYAPSGNNAINTSAILEWIPLEYAPAVMISFSGLAVVGLMDSIESSWYVRLLCLLPQQMLIAMSVIGVFTAVFNGSYADGTIKPPIHIFNDQLWLIGYFLIHAYSISRRASSR